MANPGSCNKGFRSLPSICGGKILSNGFEVKRTNIPTRKQRSPWIWSIVDFNVNSIILFLEKRKPKKLITSNHSKIEPSWLPHTPVILYISGNSLFEFFDVINKEKSDIIKECVKQIKESRMQKKMRFVNFSKVFVFWSTQFLFKNPTDG